MQQNLKIFLSLLLIALFTGIINSYNYTDAKNFNDCFNNLTDTCDAYNQC